ncbi:MAG: NAD(+) diphosphatase [Geminicoccaceae bacterium]|nr:NAD(+) diphosphatase [Geminicoccaceae bacterium]
MSRAANPPPHLYCSIGLDRAAMRRRDPHWLAQALADETTRILPMHGLKVLVDTQGEKPRLGWRHPRDLAGAADSEPLFLGVIDGRAFFTIEAPDLDRGHLDYLEVRSVGSVLGGTDAGLAAYARAMMHWRRRHIFCGNCGTRTRPIDGGHARHCDHCGLDSFPRTDPAVIVLVSDGDHCLLGRSHRIPPGIYSTLAGFVEPGESIEQTVAREVEEEVGITIDDLRYRSSQPWPFPQSLMLGFQARAKMRPLTIDPEEMEDARWFSREELLDPDRRPVQLPNTDSIARFLIDEWLLGEI